MANRAGRALRIGHLYPSGGISDHELQRMAPEGVHFLTTRLPFRRTGLADDLRLFDGLEPQARLLADAQVDLIAVNCTAATMLAGADSVNRRVKAATGIESTTTIEAVLAALQACSMRRIALLTPYVDEVVQAEIVFLAQHGVMVAAHDGLPCRSPVEQGEISPGYWLALGSRLAQTDCDGLLISCAGIQVASVLARLERHWQRPVVSSNQALVWQCLRKLGVVRRPAGYGGLLAPGGCGAGAAAQ